MPVDPSEVQTNMVFLHLPPAESARLVEHLRRRNIVTAAIANRTLSIMADCGVTFYDAVYHAIALERKGTLVTADAAYLKKAGKYGHAVLLADFG